MLPDFLYFVSENSLPCNLSQLTLFPALSVIFQIMSETKKGHSIYSEHEKTCILHHRMHTAVHGFRFFGRTGWR